LKSQKGISLISLTIYIIALTIIVSMVSVISTYFYKNMNASTETIDPLIEYTKFSSFFSDEANHENIKVLDNKTATEEDNTSYIAFDNNVQYTFIPENNAIYRNKVKICREVEYCNFEHKIKNGKNMVTVTIRMLSTEKDRIVDYTLKN